MQADLGLASRIGPGVALATWSSVGDLHADFLMEFGQPAFDLAAARNEVKETIIVPGGDHIYNVFAEDLSMAEGVIIRTAEWFAGVL